VEEPSKIGRTLLYIFLISISSLMHAQDNWQLDIQGHRGARGLMPENTIPAFRKALEIGVHTLEIDVVISADSIVIVSHEPFMSHEICKTPNGTDIKKKDEQGHNLFALSYQQIKAYDCGSKYVKRFPDQEKMKVHKPSLEDMVKEVESLSQTHGYNIEIKRKPEWDDSFHPDYKRFADLVIADIERLGIMDRTTVQCFDTETLKYIHDTYPHVSLVYLIMDRKPFERHIDELGFNPAVYSPYYKLVDKTLVDQCRQASINLIPWTVNDSADMRELIELRVDGIITDYPDRLVNVVSRLK